MPRGHLGWILPFLAMVLATPAPADAGVPGSGRAPGDAVHARAPEAPTLASRLALPVSMPYDATPALVLEPQAPDAAAPDSTDATATEAVAPIRDPSAWPQVLVRPDLLHHASLSFTLAAGFTVLFRDHAAAGGLALGLGVAKELWDSRHRGADALDLLADVLGVGVALLTVPE